MLQQPAGSADSLRSRLRDLAERHQQRLEPNADLQLLPIFHTHTASICHVLPGVQHATAAADAVGGSIVNLR